MNSNFSLPVNIGNPDEHTVAEFATIIRKLVGQCTNYVPFLSSLVHKIEDVFFENFLHSIARH